MGLTHRGASQQTAEEGGETRRVRAAEAAWCASWVRGAVVPGTQSAGEGGEGAGLGDEEAGEGRDHLRVSAIPGESGKRHSNCGEIQRGPAGDIGLQRGQRHLRKALQGQFAERDGRRERGGGPQRHVGVHLRPQIDVLVLPVGQEDESTHDFPVEGTGVHLQQDADGMVSLDALRSRDWPRIQEEPTASLAGSESADVCGRWAGAGASGHELPSGRPPGVDPGVVGGAWIHHQPGEELLGNPGGGTVARMAHSATRRSFGPDSAQGAPGGRGPAHIERSGGGESSENGSRGASDGYHDVRGAGHPRSQGGNPRGGQEAERQMGRDGVERRRAGGVPGDLVAGVAQSAQLVDAKVRVDGAPLGQEETLAGEGDLGGIRRGQEEWTSGMGILDQDNPTGKLHGAPRSRQRKRRFDHRNPRGRSTAQDAGAGGVGLVASTTPRGKTGGTVHGQHQRPKLDQGAALWSRDGSQEGRHGYRGDGNKAGEDGLEGEFGLHPESGQQVGGRPESGRVRLTALWDVECVEELTWEALAKRPRWDLEGVTEEAVRTLDLDLATRDQIDNVVGPSGDGRLSEVRGFFRYRMEALGTDRVEEVWLPLTPEETLSTLQLAAARRVVSGVLNMMSALRALEQVLGAPEDSLFSLEHRDVRAFKKQLKRMGKMQISQSARAMTPLEWGQARTMWWKELQEDLKAMLGRRNSVMLALAVPKWRRAIKSLRSFVAVSVGLELGARSADMAKSMVAYEVLKKAKWTKQQGRWELVAPREVSILLWDGKTNTASRPVAWAAGETPMLVCDQAPSACKALGMYLALRMEGVRMMKQAWRSGGFGPVDGVEPPMTVGLVVSSPSATGEPMDLSDPSPVHEMTWRKGQRWIEGVGEQGPGAGAIALRRRMAWLLVQVDGCKHEQRIVADTVGSLVTQELRDRVTLEERDIGVHVRREFTGHSLRMSMTLWALMAGVAVQDVMYAARWLSEASLRRSYDVQRPPVRIMEHVEARIGFRAPWPGLSAGEGLDQAGDEDGEEWCEYDEY